MAIIKSIKFSDRQIEMASFLADENGHPTFSSVITTALIMYYKQAAPVYLRDRIPGLGRNDSPETIAKHKVQKEEAIEEAKKESLIERKKKIIEDLGAEVKEIAGEPVAIYYTHTIHSDDRQVLPLRQLSEDLVINQYAPSRKAVEKIRKEKGRRIITKDSEQ